MDQPINVWSILPFGALLVAIALGPWLAPRWWGKHYAKVAFSLGVIPLCYYLLGLRAWDRAVQVGHEYVSFIVLIGSLYIVSGGIHINVKGEAQPGNNTVFLLLGALLANILGTTGASMLLIRPWIRMNKYRITAHHIVFFIFIVSNVGGSLTPIGDPPLFLGYLLGVPFWWVTQHCWPMWAIAVGFLLGVFYVLDSFNYNRAPKEVRTRLAEGQEKWRFDGGWNLAFLAVILGAVFIHKPAFLREALMGAAALGSLFTTRKSVHEANHFNFHPIKEVAILFIGIFATMMPALDWLRQNAGHLANPTPAMFYWGSGLLSSFLDNAPTYLSFLSVIVGYFVDAEVVEQVRRLITQHHPAEISQLAASSATHVQSTVEALQRYHGGELASGKVSVEQIKMAFLLGKHSLNQYIVAISIGSVFFGASTYIGNGPNFMVSSIAAQQKVHIPGFLGLIFKYSIPCLGPLFILLWLLFFRV
jgi:Na+/H+ antiporter NhaD/arsenite permease-like protein